MAKCYVKAFFDWIEQTAALEDDERGRLFIAILEYARSGAVPDLAGRESILFPVFKSQVDRDLESSAAYAENGKKGGKIKTSNQTEPKLTKPNQSEPKPPNKEKEEDKDKEKDKDNDKEKEIKAAKPPRAARFTPPTLAEVQAYVSERQSPVDPQGFIDFYAAKGWLVGKTPMKDWKAACRNAESWERWAKQPGGNYAAKPGYKGAEKMRHGVQNHGDDLTAFQVAAVERMLAENKEDET